MYSVIIILKGFLNREWYENVESVISNENSVIVKWWSVLSHKYITTCFDKNKIKKVKIIVNKE
jgi:hypothetical protein